MTTSTIGLTKITNSRRYSTTVVLVVLTTVLCWMIGDDRHYGGGGGGAMNGNHHHHHYNVFIVSASSIPSFRRRRSPFIVKGPVLTITLKDPDAIKRGRNIIDIHNDMMTTTEQNNNPWMDFKSLQPHVLWSIESRGRPIPAWLPCWQSFRTTVGYEYDKLRTMPSFVESNVRFSFDIPQFGGLTFLHEHVLSPMKSVASSITSTMSASSSSSTRVNNGDRNSNIINSSGSRSTTLDIQIQPYHSFVGNGGDSTSSEYSENSDGGGPHTECSIQASMGSTAYIMAKFATKRDRWLQLVRGCYQINFNNRNGGSSTTSLSTTLSTTMAPPISAVRFTPTIDLEGGQASCLVEATTRSERTKAVLNLEYDNPTLTVVHSLDARNTIAPQISLYDARILYQWDVALDSGSVRTKVDPTSAIHVTWTDRSMSGAGKWVTDVRVPLVGTTLSQLAADLRVRRQFSF